MTPHQGEVPRRVQAEGASDLERLVDLVHLRVTATRVGARMHGEYARAPAMPWQVAGELESPLHTAALTGGRKMVGDKECLSHRARSQSAVQRATSSRHCAVENV